MNDIWFTADTHYGHKNIIKYCSRPFSSADEMLEKMVENWNNVVKRGDRVYHLGDLSFLGPDKTKQVVDRLKGQIYFIRGNHDKENCYHKCIDRFIWVKDYFELKVDNKKIVLSHYPFLTWNGCHRGTWNLHGHCHGSLSSIANEHARRLDVGVDCHNFSPVNYDSVKLILDNKVYKPVDHHTENRKY